MSDGNAAADEPADNSPVRVWANDEVDECEESGPSDDEEALAENAKEDDRETDGSFDSDLSAEDIVTLVMDFAVNFGLAWTQERRSRETGSWQSRRPGSKKWEVEGPPRTTEQGSRACGSCVAGYSAIAAASMKAGPCACPRSTAPCQEGGDDRCTQDITRRTHCSEGK
ncbi:hypothetical protein MRX96_051354 [Rhipicephalus microplus]